MKKVIMFLLLAMLAGCSTAQPVLKYDPEWTVNNWKNMKIGILPVLVADQCHPEARMFDGDAVANVPFAKESLSTSRTRHLIMRQGLEPLFLRISSVNDQDKITTLQNKMGLDYLAVIQATGDYAIDNYDYTGCAADLVCSLFSRKENRAIICDSTEGKSVRIVDHGNGSSVMNALGAIFDPTSYEMAYENAFKQLRTAFRQHFVGEVVKGDCINGKGVLRFYDRDLQLGYARIVCSWKGGYAAGKGILYDTDIFDGKVRYLKTTGVWNDGKLTGGLKLMYVKGKWEIAGLISRDDISKGVVTFERPDDNFITSEIDEFLEHR